MSFYKCGHGRDIIFLDDNVLSLIHYETWRETDGFDGDKSKCFPCYLKEVDDISEVNEQ